MANNNIKITVEEDSNMLRNILNGSFKRCFGDDVVDYKVVIKLNDAHRNLKQDAKIYVRLYFYYFFLLLSLIILMIMFT